MARKPSLRIPTLHLFALFTRSSNGGGFVLWCGAGVCAGLYLFYRGFLLLQRRRLILDTPFSKIRSASMGIVEVNGLAVGPYTVTAPITARSCYYYRTLAWEWKQHGKNKQWVQVAAESVHVPFFLDDNTGRVLVDPRGAELDLHRDFQQQFCDSFFTTKEPAPANVRSFLARHGIATSNKIKVEEYCIKPKNALFVLGTLTENSDIDVTATPIRDADSGGTISPLARLSASIGGSVLSTMFDGSDEESRFAVAVTAPAAAPAQKVIRLSTASAATQSSKMSQQGKIAAAMMKAGITNPAAWAAAGLNTGAAAVSENPADGGFERHPAAVLAKGTNDKAFMISWRSQREVARSLGWKCAAMIWGGPLLSLVSLYVLVEVLHLL
jgi:hypothetical protein